MTTMLVDPDARLRPPRAGRMATIGVLAQPDDQPVVQEFFELFKTPWEFYRDDGQYDVVIQADGMYAPRPATLVVVYSSRPTAFEEVRGRRLGSVRRTARLSCRGEQIPIQATCASVSPEEGMVDVVFDDTKDPVASVTRLAGSTVVRVGYDLFAEVRCLLSSGQPPAHAAIPTLERHIALLRGWIVASGIPLVELPAVPHGHPFIVCLTHDVDHASIRLHRFDRTMFGFLYRALIGSMLDVCRGRMSVACLRQNVAAALALPLVHLGWAEDFWLRFDRYLTLEKGLGSTFFFIPVKGVPGRTRDGVAPRLRASAYAVADVAEQARSLASAGAEIGVHGIDAWLDSAAGSEERAQVACAAAVPAPGVRMHWLYFDDQAPARLEEAGFAYDSTFGFNETIGFRAGTLQAFKPISARRLLELPLHVMDTALFYPSRLHLTARDAQRVVEPLLAEAERHGGALTVNWHDRSVAPERLWDGFYIDLLDDLKRRNPWFPTASQAVSWFRRRRSARFNAVRQDGNALRLAISADAAEDGPPLTVRIHRPGAHDAPWPTPADRRATFTDVPLSDSIDARLEL